MNKNECLTNGYIKLLIAHDGNYNDIAIDSFSEMLICDENENVVKTIPLPGEITLTYSTEVTEENREFIESFVAEMRSNNN